MTAKGMSNLLIAALSIAVIVLARVMVQTFWQEEAAYMPFLPAVLFTAYVGGTVPGCVTVILGVLAGNILFVEPRYQVHASTVDILQSVIFAAIGFITCFVVGAVQRSRLLAEISSREAASRQRQLEVETTERMRILGDLRDSEAQLHRLADALPHMVWVARPDGHNLHANHLWMEYTGLSREETLGKGWLVAVHPEDRKPAFRRWRIARDTGEPYETECRFRGKDGVYRWFLGRALPVRDRNGTIIKWFGTSTDIDAQKQTGQELAERLDHEHKQRTLIKEVADASLTIHSAFSLDSVLQIVTDEARLIIGAHQAIGSLTVNENWEQAIHSVSFSEKYAAWRTRAIPMDPAGIYSIVCQTQRPLRLTQAQLLEHPDLKVFENDGKHPPLAGWLASPLVGRNGSSIGVLQLSEKIDGEFTEDDESVLLQLANIAAVAIENVRLYEAMRDADRRKDEFLALLAHELRNPLAPIRNSLQVLRLTGGKGKDAEHALAVMERQIHHMVRLVDDLLDIARIEKGKLTLKIESLDLRQALSSAIEAARPLIDSFGHSLTMQIPDQPIPMRGDMARLTQVFQNLLNNAAKYTDRNGAILLSVTTEDKSVFVRIVDNGIGIPREMLPTIFEMFTQVDRSLERTRGGLGIGLTLVYNLIRMHGGSVSASSEGIAGKGSEFVVSLPLALASSPEVTNENNHATVNLRSRRILVVDDNVDSAESLGRLLELTGHEVRIAHDGLSALDEAASFEPEVVFLDIGLPRLNGYEVGRRLRTNASSSGKLLLIALTGWGQSEDRRRSKEAGFDHHLTKPVDPEMIEEILAAFAKGLV